MFDLTICVIVRTQDVPGPTSKLIHHLIFRKKVLASIQHACGVEIAELEQQIHGLSNGYFSPQDFPSIPGFVQGDDKEPHGNGSDASKASGHVPPDSQPKNAGESPSSRRYSSSPLRARMSALLLEDKNRHKNSQVSRSISPKTIALAAHEDSTADINPEQVTNLDGGKNLLGDSNVPDHGKRIRRRHSLFESYTEAVINVRTRRSEEELVLGKKPEGARWWKNRDRVEALALTFSACTAASGIFGTFMAIFQNELIYQEYNPMGTEINFLKSMNTLCSILCVGGIYVNYYLHSLVFRVNRHCRRLTPLETGPVWIEILLRQPSFWAEIIICGIHCPPFISQEVSTSTYDNLVVYRIETLATLYNTLRFYLIWKYLRDRELALIPRRHMITGFTGAKFGSVYVLKTLLRGWNGLITIAILWTFALVIFAYWFRAAEITACALSTTVSTKCELEVSKAWSMYGRNLDHSNDFYVWDALW